MSANPIALVVIAIAALVAIFVVAYKKSETFRDIISASWEAIRAATAAVFGWIQNAIAAAFDFLKNVFFNFTGPGIIIKHWDTIKTATSNAWNAVKNFVSNAINSVRDTVSSIVNKVRSLLTDAWNSASSATSRIWTGIRNAVSDSISGLMGAVSSIPGRITGVFLNAGSWLYSAGVNVVRGLINGIKAMASAAVNAVTGVVGGAIDRAKSLLHIGSPSRLFRQFGVWTVEGLAIGLDRTAGKAAAASGRLANAVARGFSAPDLALSGGGATAAFASAARNDRGRTYEITVQAPVGSSSADIGRTLIKHIDAYEAAGGRRRA